jgi:hypothetical protein
LGGGRIFAARKFDHLKEWIASSIPHAADGVITS